MVNNPNWGERNRETLEGKQEGKERMCVHECVCVWVGIVCISVDMDFGLEGMRYHPLPFGTNDSTFGLFYRLQIFICF